MSTQKRKEEYLLREKIKRYIFSPPKDINIVVPNLIEEYDTLYKLDPMDQDVTSNHYGLRLRILIYLLYILYKNNIF